MNRRTRLMVLSTLGAASVCLAMAALAWACTPQAFISLSPSSGLPGTVVTVSGHGFVSGGPVEVRMGAVNGAPITTATGSTFAVTVTIPQSAAGGYQTLGAIGYDTSGQAQGSAAATFLVQRDAPAPLTPKQPAGRLQHGHTPPAARSHHTTPVAHSHHPTPAARSAPALVVSSTPAVTGTPTPAPVFRPAASLPAVALPQAPVHKALRLAPHHDLLVSEPKARIVASHAQPWPAASAPTDTHSGGGVNPLALGIGLLATGLVALFAGFAVAEVRRRRAPVRARR